MVGAVSTRGRCPSCLSAEAGGVESTEAPEGSKIPTPAYDFRLRDTLSGGFSLRCAASQSFGLTTGDYTETGQILREQSSLTRKAGSETDSAATSFADPGDCRRAITK
jgi:hypothetical protein